MLSPRTGGQSLSPCFEKISSLFVSPSYENKDLWWRSRLILSRVVAEPESLEIWERGKTRSDSSVDPKSRPFPQPSSHDPHCYSKLHRILTSKLLKPGFQVVPSYQNSKRIRPGQSGGGESKGKTRGSEGGVFRARLER